MLKRPMFILIVVATLTACGSPSPTATLSANDPSASGQTAEWNFDGIPVDHLPDGAQAFSGSWAVRADLPGDAPSQPNALCQTGAAEFPALSLSDDVYADATISTIFKPISGATDRAAGIIFRIQNANNYYILRANALEANVNLYKYVNGQRSEIKGGAGQVASDQWQTLRVEAVGKTLRGYLNDQLVVETADSTFSAGKVGLWTKADSVTCFDDVMVSVPQ